VSQSKFTVLKITRIYNFCEFMEFFLKGLNPFKIQTRFKLELLLNFIIQHPDGFRGWDKKEICSI
jgi:hypothetical protein